MEQVRIGIIGIGSMGLNHARYLVEGEVPGGVLTAVSARSIDRMDEAKKQLGPEIAYFNNATALMTSGLVDAVLIVTPHYTHVELTIEALQRGLHVMLEKPAGVFTEAVIKMNRVAQESGLVFGMMYQHRTNPVFQKLKAMVDAGELGELKRTTWIDSFRYRAQSYYDMDAWRGTWDGDGGGSCSTRHCMKSISGNGPVECPVGCGHFALSANSIGLKSKTR